MCRVAKAVAGPGGVAGPTRGLGARGAASLPETLRKHGHRLLSRPPGSRPRGPPGMGGVGAAGVGPGRQGSRLHSGQSSRGTPEPPGSRTGTRPAWGRGGVGLCQRLSCSEAAQASPGPPEQPAPSLGSICLLIS